MKTHGVTRFGAIASLFCVQTASALAVTFTQDTLIGFSDLAYEGADIVVTNCTLTVDGPHIFRSLQVQNAGVLTHSPNTNGPQLFTFLVSNEPHVMSATNPTTIYNANVDTSTIVVLNTSHTTLYTLGVDYLVTLSGKYVQLTLTTNSAIAEGATVLVNYTWAQNVQGFTLYINDGVEIQAGGAIDVSGKGYAGGLGVNPGPNGGAGTAMSTNFPFSFNAGAGGGHGGAGGMSSTFARGGASYDSTINPVSLGSGGGIGNSKGGSGGGSATIVSGGNFQIDGLILAGGSKATNAHSGGGAGGSLLLSADSFSGAGTISANGGGGDTPDGGGGGGGRIALFFGTNGFTGALTAFGGGGSTAGGAGTIYLQGDNELAGQLFIVNAGKRGTNTLFTAAISDLTISGGAVAQADTQPMNFPNFSVTNLFVGSNSWLSAWDGASPFTMMVNGNATVESGGAINADFKSTVGAGTGTSSCGAGSGASYGGYGGASVCGARAGAVYGSISQPSGMGSPGPSGPLPATRGGGAIKLTVAGNLSLDGRISANGAGAGAPTAGSGSGGGIWLTVGTLSGAGAITANGGSASNLVSGGGGGGRIAVYFGTNLFTGNIFAHGGTGTNSGGAGSIYLKSRSDSLPQIIFDNGGVAGATFLNLPMDNSDLTISGGTTLTNFSSTPLNLRSLSIGSNSWLTASPGFTPGLSGTITNVTIARGGGITMDGAATFIGQGSGSTVFVNNTQVGGGGGHGGYGGAAGGTNIGGGFAFDSYASATSLGGTGGSGSGTGGFGGGVISLTVPQTLNLDGQITANGLAGINLNSGAGAGGSIRMVASVITGSGAISANGGAGNNLGGGGAGGMISVNVDTNLFSGPMTAVGGSGGNYGGAGTVYLTRYTQQGKTPTQLTLDNGGNRGARTPLIISQDISGLTITGGAVLSNSVPNFSPLLGNLLVGSNSVFLGYPGTSSTLTVSNVTILAGGSMNVDGVNTLSGNGQGQTLGETGGGGGNAGSGGPSVLGAAGGFIVQNSTTSPTSAGGRGGAGGGPQINGNGGNGGGAMRLTVNGTLRVDGKLSAEGAAAPVINSGGGAGGSLWVTTKTLTGSGVISANGGNGNLGGGGGGGGAISISFTTNSFTGAYAAHGGTGVNAGGAGLVYTSGTEFPPGSAPQLTADNGGLVGGGTALSGSLQSANMTITGGAIFSGGNSFFNPLNLFIGSNSTFSVFATSPVNFTVQTNLTIQAGGVLSLDGLVTTGGQAIGQSGGTRGGGGGGHGGYGGTSFSNILGGTITSDSITSPTGLGSSGGSGTPAGGSSNFGGGGGGALQLTVRGTLQLDGRISANGLTTVSNINSGGGSGGSLYLQVGKIAGTGAISADGGAANGLGGGGAGGRVALWYNTNQFTGNITARGGGGANFGGAGTVYLNSGMTFQRAPSRLIFDNGGHGGSSAVLTPLSQVDVLITNGATVAYGLAGGGGTYWNNLTITSNSVLTTTSNLSTLTLYMTSNLDLQTGGRISADRLVPANSGTGHGRTIGGAGGGGGHGGNGSAGIGTNAGGGVAYDSISQPTLVGSGGGSITPTSGSAGGGAILLVANGKVNVNGVISANGGSATTAGAGGGSGGAVEISAASISGNGRISADGGSGDIFTSGGGGGGRIGLFFSSNLFTGTLSAQGGAGVFLAGGAGTIYFETYANFTRIGQILVDNGGQAGTNTPLSGLFPTTALALRNGAVADSTTQITLQSLLIDSGASLAGRATTPPLIITVNGNALVDTNGSIVSDATGYNPDTGPGSGTADYLSGDGSGGGYGGAGGASFYGTPGGGTYGSSNQPTSLGSAGGVLPPLAGYSRGGGAIRLAVNGKLTVNGIISANGADGFIDGSGGGSGGSIWISAPAFAGNGWVLANGGMGEGFEGGGGGGGRIAIYTPTNSFAGNLLAFGGDGANPGQDGTLYVPTSLLISGSVTDTNGIGIAGFTLQPSGFATLLSDTNGAYSLSVPPLWSGSITPSGSGVIVPSVRNYTSLMSNPTAEDFLVTTAEAFNLSNGQFDGTNVTFNWYGMSGVLYQVQYSSNLTDWAPYTPPYLGGNAPISITVPPQNSPQLYFRLNVVY